MGVFSTINCSEESGTRVENIEGQGKPSASVTVRCAYGDRWNLIDDIVYNGRTWPVVGKLNLLPLKSASIKPTVDGNWDATDQTINYIDALIDLSYGLGESSSTETSAGGTVFAESLEGTVEMLKQDHKRFVWIDTATPGVETGEVLEAEAPSVPIYGQNLKRTIFNVATIPSAVNTSLGKCNVAAYTSLLLGRTFAAETLLFKPAKQRRDLKADGSGLGWTVDLEFVYNQNGWNKFWRAVDQDWRRFAVKKWNSATSTWTLTPYKPIPTADFSSFFA